MNSSTTLLDFFLSLSVFVIIGYLLIIGQDLFIPFIVALGIWFMIISLADSLSKIQVNDNRIPYWLSMTLAIVIIFMILWIIFSIITDNISNIISSLKTYQEKLDTLVIHALKALGIDKPLDYHDFFKEFNLLNISTSIAQAITSIASKTGIILIYVLFLLMERHSFDKKISYLFPNPEKAENTRQIIRKIADQTKRYLKMKTLISLITAVLSYCFLKLIGLDFATFWALIIFLLNFIPTIGSFIGTILPCMLSLVQFDSWIPFIVLSIGLTSIQFILGNIIEPKVIGKTMNLSGLVIILSLIVWGYIWGISGMFLCIPIMVILNIIFANFPRTRFIPILFSQHGEIED